MVQLLGNHADITVHENVVAMKGVRVSEWKGSRSLSAVFLTVVEVNPSENQYLTIPAEIEVSSPVKKALHMKASEPITASRILELVRQRGDHDATGALDLLDERAHLLDL